MAKGVVKSSQMTLKMSGRKERKPQYVGPIKRNKEDLSWMKKAPGSGLDNYVLDLMKLN
jgi:hypothetical protein